MVKTASDRASSYLKASVTAHSAGRSDMEVLWCIAAELAEANAGEPKRSYPPGAHQCSFETKKLDLGMSEAETRVLCNVCKNCGRVERI